jgi:hypothetical protein
MLTVCRGVCANLLVIIAMMFDDAGLDLFIVETLLAV